MRSAVSMVLCGVLALGPLSGCSNSDEVTVTETESPKFTSQGVKAKSDITLLNRNVSIVFELYVDNEGDGQGLMGYNNKTYPVYVCKDLIFVEISEKNIVCVDDLSAHLIPVDTTSFTEADGFKTSNSKIVGYYGTTSSLQISSKYETSVIEFDTISVSDKNRKSLEDLSTYIDSYLAEQSPVTESPTTPKEVSKESFYNQFDTGVKIGDKVYSCGDYCNPATYFQGLEPESISTKVVDNEGSNVHLQIVSYLSSDGRTVFTLDDGYVISIYTNSKFEWCNLKHGTAKADFINQIGYKLTDKKKAELNWSPIYRGLECTGNKSNSYYLTVGTLNAEASVSKDGVLSSIYVKKHMEYEEYQDYG